MYTVFVPDFLKNANSTENSIENKIKKFISIDEPLEIIFTDSYRTNIKSLLEKPYSFFINFMSEMPHGFPDGLVAAALSERADHQMQMVYNAAGYDVKAGSIKSGIKKVGMLEPIYCDQIEAIDNNFLPSLYDLQEKLLIEYFDSQKLDALFLPASLVPFYTKPKSVLHTQNFHFSEIIPPVGSGVLCALTLDDATETRKFLRTFHHAPTAECVNVERQLRQLAHNNLLSAYVYTDRSHYFHLYAALRDEDCHFRKAQISRSTTFELAEAAWAALKEQKVQ